MKRHTREEAERVVMKLGGTLEEVHALDTPECPHNFHAVAREGETWDGTNRVYWIRFNADTASETWGQLLRRIRDERIARAVREAERWSSPN